MAMKKPKSLNGEAFKLASKKLNLKRREKIILQRLMGFLIRNDKPFPYSSKAMSELTGYSRSSIFESINILEKMRLVERIGFSTNVKYKKGSILKRICSLVQKRINFELINNCSPVQFLDELSPTSPVSGYKKTSLSLKHKDKEDSFLTLQEEQDLKWFSNNPQFKMPERLQNYLLAQKT